MYFRKFFGGTVVRTQRFHCQGPGSITGWGTKIPQAAWCDQKKDVFESYNTQNCTCNRIRREISEIQIYLSMYKQSMINVAF